MHKEENFADTRARLDAEGFAVKSFELNGETLWLIFPPHSGIEWNEDNLIYRSGIWTDDGEAVSLSWRKFFNWDERCDLCPKPVTLDECELMNKEDGSTLIVSKHKGELIMRTRGSNDMTVLDNGHEKDMLIAKYPKFFEFLAPWPDTFFSFVFEWETPTNKIIIDYGEEPRLVLTGMIDHYDYTYVKQDKLDEFAAKWNMPRPKRYTFDNIDQMEKELKDAKGIEGVCVYYANGQEIKKMKTSEYLMFHSIKFKLGYKALVEMIYEDNVKIDEFKKHIEAKFDYEGLVYIENLIDEIYDADKHLKGVIMWYYEDIMMKYNPENKKEFAAVVFDKELNYKCYSGFLFKLFESEDADLRHVLMNNVSVLRTFKQMILEEVTS